MHFLTASESELLFIHLLDTQSLIWSWAMSEAWVNFDLRDLPLGTFFWGFLRAWLHLLWLSRKEEKEAKHVSHGPAVSQKVPDTAMQAWKALRWSRAGVPLVWRRVRTKKVTTPRSILPLYPTPSCTSKSQTKSGVSARDSSVELTLLRKDWLPGLRFNKSKEFPKLPHPQIYDGLCLHALGT